MTDRTPPPPRANPNAPTLDQLPPLAQADALAYYEAGLDHGIAMGRRQAEEEFAALHRQAHAVVQDAARTPTYAEACDRSGEHERAQRQRDELRRRGIK